MMYYMLCLLGFCLTSGAADRLLFDQANSLYEQGIYEQALHTYARIEQKTSAVWYNMASAASHMKDSASAYLYLLRAQKQGDAQMYRLSSNRLIDVPPMQHTDSTRFMWIQWLSKYISLYTLQLLFLLAWYLACFMVYARYRNGWCIGIVSAIMLIAFPIMVVGYYGEQPRALVIRDTVVYNGPNNLYYALETVTQGSLVNIRDNQGAWCKISYDKVAGWVNSEYIAQI